MDSDSIAELMQVREHNSNESVTDQSASDGELLRLILTIRESQDQTKKSLDPGDFSSRADYRRELIARQLEVRSLSGIDDLAARFESMGLNVHYGNLSSNLIVEGKVSTLRSALAEELVESAVRDEKLELIKPTKMEDRPP